MKLHSAIFAFTLTVFGSVGFPAFAHASSAPASCASAFTSGFSRDSASFSFNDGGATPELLSERLEDARKVVRQVAETFGCSVTDLGLATQNAKSKDACAELVPGNPASVSCYVEGTDGYFFVTRDLLDNATVVFNRWD